MFPISAADFPREPAERRNGAWRGQGAGFVLSRGPIGTACRAKTSLYGLTTPRTTGWRKAKAVASHKRVWLK